MSEALWYRFGADAVLLLHAGIVCFVILGPILVVAGNLRGWRWVNAFSFRAAHAGAIAIVIAESWFGIACPLTLLELRLREGAGTAVYAGGFIEHWLQRVLFYDFPGWAFTFAYSLFGVVVLAVWRRFPPEPRRRLR